MECIDYEIIQFSPVTSFLLGPHLFSNTFDWCSSFDVSPSFIAIQHKKKNYNFVHFNLFIFRKKLGRPYILNWMVPRICWIQFTLNLLINAILICHCHPQNISTLPYFQRIFLYMYYDILFHCGDKTASEGTL